MGEKRLAGEASLRLVLLCREIIGTAQELEVVARTVAAHLVHQLHKAQIHSPPRSLRDGGFTSRVHIPLYSDQPPNCEPFLRNAGGRFPIARPTESQPLPGRIARG